MADFFENERQLFKEIETGNGLNEGDILKSIQRLDEQIKQEEDLQASEDLTIATNQNVNPNVAAKFAGLAGTNITTGDQLKKAKPILQRMSKTLTDPNIPADVREASMARDREDLEQITLRSTVQDGQRGVEVTGRIPSESAIFDRPERGPVQFEEGRSKFISPEDAPFFPEPGIPERQQETEQFMQTLEPESSAMGGVLGQRDIAQKKARNDLRKTEFQAGRAKQVTVKPGEKIFDVRPGEAEPIGGVAATVKPVEGPTKSSVEGAVLQKVMNGEELTPGEQKIYVGTRKKGFSVTLPDGTTIQQGGTGDELGKLSPGARTQVQREIRDARGRLIEFTNLAKNPKFDPEKNLTFYSAGLAKLGGFLDEISPNISDAFALKDNIKDWNAFLALTENLFTAWRRSVTGVAFRPEEETALRKAFPSTKDGPTAYRAKLEAVSALNKRIIERLQTRRPGDKIDVLGELSAVQSEGVDDTSGDQLTVDLASRILQSAGGNKELARQKARELGYSF